MPSACWNVTTDRFLQPLQEPFVPVRWQPKGLRCQAAAGPGGCRLPQGWRTGPGAHAGLTQLADLVNAATCGAAAHDSCCRSAVIAQQCCELYISCAHIGRGAHQAACLWTRAPMGPVDQHPRNIRHQHRNCSARGLPGVGDLCDSSARRHRRCRSLQTFATTWVFDSEAADIRLAPGLGGAGHQHKLTAAWIPCSSRYKTGDRGQIYHFTRVCGQDSMNLSCSFAHR